MPIPFFEPKSPRYIYVNPLTNKVHLLVPVVGGQEISTDNTCKSTVALDEFFGGAAEQELQSYRAALENDLELLPEGDTPLRRGKEERLAQIKSYIEVVEEMRHKKGSMIIQPLMEKTTNLHSIQLRPSVQDPASRVINPVFTVDRSNDEFGNPNSKLYNAMQLKYPSVISVIPDPMARLKKAVLDGLPEGKPDFELIQQRLKVQCMQLFDLDVDFTKTNIRKARVSDFEMTLTKESLGRFMGFQEDTTSNEDYIDALIGACAAEIGPTIQTPPFYSVPEHSDKAEKLSIMTQFFLAQVNIYCVTRGLSTANFGAVLDVSEDLSNQVADIVKSSLGEGADVENKLCEFFNRNKVSFGLTRDLESADVELIRQKFERTYRTVTATKENPHMDDFMVLDVTPGGSFFTHKGSICTDFANLVGDEAKYKYFADIRADFQTLVDGVAERNDWVQGSYEIDTSMIKDKKLAEWPSEIHKQVFDLYLIALKRDDAEMLAAILEVADNDPNILFEQSPDGGLPFIGLAEKPKLFETVVKKIDIGKLDQENLSRYYLVALFYKNPDLCAKISSKIEDKSTLFHSPDIDANPFELLLERKDIFIKLVSTVTIADLNPETLKRVYQLSLEHEATEICSECVKQLVAKPQKYDVLEYYLLALYAEKGD